MEKPKNSAICHCYGHKEECSLGNSNNFFSSRSVGHAISPCFARISSRIDLANIHRLKNENVVKACAFLYVMNKFNNRPPNEKY
jgi:hypothetical protein